MEGREPEIADDASLPSPGPAATTDAGGDFGTAQGGDLGEPPPVEDDDVPPRLSKEEADRALGGTTTTEG